jgi:UDP-N-acetylglucosamine 2-epimerase
VETVEKGWNLLVGTDARRILEGVSHVESRKRLKGRRGLFGDGRAAEKIVEILASFSG